MISLVGRDLIYGQMNAGEGMYDKWTYMIPSKDQSRGWMDCYFVSPNVVPMSRYASE